MKSKILGFIWAILSATGIVSAQSTGGYNCFGPWNMMGGFGAGPMMFFGLIFWVLLLAALVLFIAWLVRQLQSPKYRR
jgi:uncharacterized membrane protein